jgi:hypothetical protein
MHMVAGLIIPVDGSESLVFTNATDVAKRAAAYFAHKWNVAGGPDSEPAHAAVVFRSHSLGDVDFSEEQWTDAIESIKPQVICDYIGVAVRDFQIEFKAAPKQLAKTLNGFLSSSELMSAFQITGPVRGKSSPLPKEDDLRSILPQPVIAQSLHFAVGKCVRGTVDEVATAFGPSPWGDHRSTSA